MTNWKDIKNPQVQSADPTIATVGTQANGDITITGVKAGNTNLTITGDNANTKTIPITVNPAKIDIATDKTSSSVNVSATDTIKVTNYADITNFSLKVADETVATVSNSNGTLTVNGVKVGSTTVTLSGDNANDKVINITVSSPPKKDISLSKSSSTVEVGSTDTVTITNFSEITNPKATTEDSQIATASL